MAFSPNASVKLRAQQNSNIDVKEIRKKFEVASLENGGGKRISKLDAPRNSNDFTEVKEKLQRSVEKKLLKLRALDSDDETKLENHNIHGHSIHNDGIPKPPARRNRNKPLNLQKMKAVKVHNTTDSVPDSNLVEKQVNSISVRERSRLFESQSDLNNQGNAFSAKEDKFQSSLNPLQGPVKPPRTPHKNQFSDLNTRPCSNGNMCRTVEDDTLQKLVNLNTGAFANAEMRASSSKKPAFNSISLDAFQASKSAPRLSSPEIGVPKGPKISLYANKTKVFNFCKNNLSNVAQNIRGKMSNKPSSPDLTSSVSPMKGRTLRKSFSDEHIYAEPFESEPVKIQNSHASSDVNVLHYMCTPLVDRDFGDEKFLRHGMTENLNYHAHLTSDSKHSKTALRKIIYESFSLLRRAPDAESNLHDNVNGDSESDVSAKDVAERITYVRSMKKQASTSSICIAPKLFDAILILSVSESGPQVLYKQSKAASFDYPLIQHLCFPDYKNLHKAEVYKSEWFQFTLVHGNDEKMFGYCHRILGWSEAKHGFCRKLPVAVCILSGISAPLFYKKILMEIEKHLLLPTNKCKEYLKALQKLGVPNAGASLSIPDSHEDKSSQIVISRPFDSHTVGLELTRSLQLLDVDVLLKAIASLLLERRVLMLSNNTRNLLHCCTAVSSLLYPFQWQHLMMPIVPSCLAVQCCIESPYLLGIVSNNHNDILDLLGEQQVFVVDTDKGAILKSFGDEDTILPKKVQKAVICALNLAKNMTDPTEMMRDIMISEAIVHMFVELVGHCQNHFISQNCCFTFQKDAFQKNSTSRSIQSFLEWFSETQMFEAFIEECIWRKTYRDICQSQLLTFFEKRVEEYNWELAYNNDRITRKIVKRVQDFGEKLKGLTKS